MFLYHNILNSSSFNTEQIYKYIYELHETHILIILILATVHYTCALSFCGILPFLVMIWQTH